MAFALAAHPAFRPAARLPRARQLRLPAQSRQPQNSPVPPALTGLRRSVRARAKDGEVPDWLRYAGGPTHPTCLSVASTRETALNHLPFLRWVSTPGRSRTTQSRTTRLPRCSRRRRETRRRSRRRRGGALAHCICRPASQRQWQLTRSVPPAQIRAQGQLSEEQMIRERSGADNSRYKLSAESLAHPLTLTRRCFPPWHMQLLRRPCE